MSILSAFHSASDRPSSPAHSVRGSEAPDWVVMLAKAGYGARGIIYVIIGGLAFLEAIGHGGESTDSKGAIEQVLSAPGGSVLLWILALGLIGYSAWRFCQAILDADNHGRESKGMAIRAGLFVSAITHLGLAIYAIAAATRNSDSSAGGSSSSESLVARILGWPGGQWIVGLIGLAIISAAVALTAKAVKEGYKKRFAVDDATMGKLNGICKFGLIARSVAFAIIGGMFIAAALTQDPNEAGGLREVLQQTAEQPFGPYLLGILAIGLMAFGLYSLIEMLYRRIQKPDFIAQRQTGFRKG